MEERKKDKKQDVILIGRNLAWIKKRDPELYEILMKRAEEEGTTASEILLRALRYSYIDSESTLDTLTARQFLVLMSKYNELQTEFMKNMLDFVSVFFKLGFEKITDIINVISESIEEEMKEKEKEKPKRDPTEFMSIIMGLINSLPNIFMNMYTNINELMKTNLMKQQEIKQ